MRGRILIMAMAILGAAALAGCTKRDSLYIEPGKEATPDSTPPKQAPAQPAPAKPAETPAPKS